MMMNHTLYSVRFALTALIILLLSPLPALAQEAADCHPEHPLSPPRINYTESCEVCAMTRDKWARTWMTYSDADGIHHLCSINCLANATGGDAGTATDIRTALYLTPEIMVPASDAVWVVGSSARGTMSHVSKIAFPGEADAAQFTKQCGGKLQDFSSTFQVAHMEILQKAANQTNDSKTQ